MYCNISSEKRRKIKKRNPRKYLNRSHLTATLQILTINPNFRLTRGPMQKELLKRPEKKE